MKKIRKRFFKLISLLLVFSLIFPGGSFFFPGNEAYAISARDRSVWEKWIDEFYYNHFSEIKCCITMLGNRYFTYRKNGIEYDSRFASKDENFKAWRAASDEEKRQIIRWFLGPSAKAEVFGAGNGEIMRKWILADNGFADAKKLLDLRTIRHYATSAAYHYGGTKDDSDYFYGINRTKLESFDPKSNYYKLDNYLHSSYMGKEYIYTAIDLSEVNELYHLMLEDYERGRVAYERLAKLVVEAHDIAISGGFSGLTNIMLDAISAFGKPAQAFTDQMSSLVLNAYSFTMGSTQKYQELKGDIQNFIYGGPYVDEKYAAGMCGYLMKLAGYVEKDCNDYYDHAFHIKENELEEAAGKVVEDIEKKIKEEEERVAREQYNKDGLSEKSVKILEGLGGNASRYRTEVENVVVYETTGDQQTVNEGATRYKREEKIRELYEELKINSLNNRASEIQERLGGVFNQNGWVCEDAYYAGDQKITDALNEGKGFFAPNLKTAFPYVDMKEGSDEVLTDFRQHLSMAELSQGFSESNKAEKKRSEEILLNAYKKIKNEYASIYSGLDGLYKTVLDESKTIINNTRGLEILSGELGTGEFAGSGACAGAINDENKNMDILYTSLAVFDGSNTKQYDETMSNIKANYENALAGYELYKADLKKRAGKYKELLNEAENAFKKFKKENDKVHDMVNSELPDYVYNQSIQSIDGDQEYAVIANSDMRNLIDSYDPEDYPAGLKHYRDELISEYDKLEYESRKSDCYAEALAGYEAEIKEAYSDLTDSSKVDIYDQGITKTEAEPYDSFLARSVGKLSAASRSTARRGYVNEFALNDTEYNRVKTVAALVSDLYGTSYFHRQFDASYRIAVVRSGAAKREFKNGSNATYLEITGDLDKAFYDLFGTSGVTYCAGYVNAGDETEKSIWDEREELKEELQVCEGDPGSYIPLTMVELSLNDVPANYSAAATDSLKEAPDPEYEVETEERYGIEVLGDGEDEPYLDMPDEEADYKEEFKEDISDFFIDVNEPDLVLNKGEIYRIKYNSYPTDATDKKIKWNSMNTDVATVDSSGAIHAVSEGSVIISGVARDADTTVTRDADGNISVTVPDQYRMVLTLKVNPGSVDPDTGEEALQKYCTVTYCSNGSNEDDVIETVEKGSKVTLKGDMFKRTGYYLSGWRNENETEYNNGAEIKITGDTTFYVIWKKGADPVKPKDPENSDNPDNPGGNGNNDAGSNNGGASNGSNDAGSNNGGASNENNDAGSNNGGTSNGSNDAGSNNGGTSNGSNVQENLKTIEASSLGYTVKVSMNASVPFTKNKKEVVSSLKVTMEALDPEGKSCGISIKSVKSNKPKNGIAKVTIKMKGSSKPERKALKAVNRKLKKIPIEVEAESKGES